MNLYIDNMGVRFIIRRMTGRSPRTMREVRALQRLLDRTGLSLDPQWLPLAQKYFADRQSPTWDPGDIQVRACLLRELLAKYAHAPLVGDGVWKYRPLEIRPVAARKVSLTALEKELGRERARLYCPPADLITLTVAKMRREGRGVSWWCRTGGGTVDGGGEGSRGEDVGALGSGATGDLVREESHEPLLVAAGGGSGDGGTETYVEGRSARDDEGVTSPARSERGRCREERWERIGVDDAG